MPVITGIICVFYTVSVLLTILCAQSNSVPLNSTTTTTTTTSSYEEEIFILNINIKGTTPKPDLSVDHWMTTVLEVPRWVDTTTVEFSKDIQSRLEKLLRLAFHLQQSQHFGNPGKDGNPESPGNSSSQLLDVEILNITRIGKGDQLQILYAVRYNGWYVKAQTVMEDLRQLGPQYMTLYLGYAWVENKPYTAPELRETSNAWIIGVVIGAVLLLLLLGWCCLFAYYNTCGRQFQLAAVAAATKLEKVKETQDKAIQEGSKNDYSATPILPQVLISTPQKVYLTEHDAQTDPKFYENYLFDDIKHIEAAQSRDEVDSKAQLSNSTVTIRDKPIGLMAPKDNRRLSAPDGGQQRLSSTLNLPKIITTQTSLDQSKQSTIQGFVDQHLSASRLQRSQTVDVISTSLQPGAKRHTPMDLRPVYGDFRSLLPDTQSPHQTAHEIEYLYRIKESVEQSHPRPRMSENGDGTLVLHTKDFWSTRLKPESFDNRHTNTRPSWDHIVIGPYQ